MPELPDESLCWYCQREPAEKHHVPCCSSHGRPLCCACYCRLHFVEVNPCSKRGHADPGPVSDWIFAVTVTVAVLVLVGWGAMVAVLGLVAVIWAIHQFATFYREERHNAN